jgi:CheY-like chemotaxis protein
MSASPILLVEDDPDIQELLRLFLELEGFRVNSATNGLEALDYLKEGNPACVILLDLMMPIMNGYEFLNEFYSDSSKKFGEIPIIVISAATDIEPVARKRGIPFVKKPIDLDVLLTTIGGSCSATATPEL